MNPILECAPKGENKKKALPCLHINSRSVSNKCSYSLNPTILYSVVFRNATSGEIKDHSLRTTPFQKKFFSYGILGLFLPYVKKHFQESHLGLLFFMAQITQILPHIYAMKKWIGNNYFLSKNLYIRLSLA